MSDLRSDCQRHYEHENRTGLDGVGVAMNKKELKPGQVWKMEERGRYSFEIVNISLSGAQLSFRIHSVNGAPFEKSPISVMKTKEFAERFNYLEKDVK
jgi:hypothetical protein